MSSQIQKLLDKNAQALLLVSNPLEGAEVVRTVAAMEESRRIPIISHWGISAGNFYQDAGPALSKVDVSFIQSYSFLKPDITPKSQSLIGRYLEKFPDCKSARDIHSPVGTAHAYEIVTMFAEAVKNAGTANAEETRTELETLETYSGIIRDYAPPFRADHHDALNADDFVLARFATDGAIIPVVD